MKTNLLLLALASVLSGQLCSGQTNEQVVEDFLPSSLNQPNKQYPQVNSERRVRARVVAPQATNVVFEFLGGAKYSLTTFKEKVKLVFVSYGSRENGAAGKANVESLKEAGIKSVFYESPNTGHEWLTWRRSLHEFAPLLFKN